MTYLYAQYAMKYVDLWYEPRAAEVWLWYYMALEGA